MKRPSFEDINSGAEFNQWYWLKDEMVVFCKRLNLPAHGRKFELRDRLMYALDNNGSILKEAKPKKSLSDFNWAKAELSLETKITDNVSFGPNFRGFMKMHIGPSFSCHSDFMDWVKANPGRSLGDAINQWLALEKRKKTPGFKRQIADNNMYAQYTRDFLSDNKGMRLSDAKKYWLIKKELPTTNGFVRYDPSDLHLDPKEVSSKGKK